jgi:hypothetical protein
MQRICVHASLISFVEMATKWSENLENIGAGGKLILKMGHK